MRTRILKRLALFALLAGAGATATAETVHATRIWDLLRDMRTTGADERSVEALFGARIDTRYDNTAWNFFEGKGPTLGDGVEVAKFGFMTKMDGAAPPWIYLDLAGRCITYDDVRKAYPNLRWDGKGATVHAPRMVYLSRHADGEMHFSFDVTAAMTARCLVNVGFSPKT